MVIQAVKSHTVEEFDEFVKSPENADKSFEFIRGEIIEVVSNSYSSEIAMLIGAALLVFARERKLGRVTGADGGYVIGDERYIPDVAFISFLRQPEISRDAYNPNPPDLAVEVLSPANDPADMRIKMINYLRTGVTVWIVDPDKKLVEVYSPQHSPKTVGVDGILDGGDVLPGFQLAVKDIFPEE